MAKNKKKIAGLLLIKILIISFFVLFQTKLFANDYRFKHLSVEEGLTQVFAACIVQDDIGRTWIGTGEGLNCFDGVSVTNYYSDIQDSTTLLSNRVRNLVNLNYGILCRSDDGISILNFDTNKFRRYYISNLYDVIVHENIIYYGCNDGVFILNPENGESKLFLKGFHAVKLFIDSKNRFWIGFRDKGLILYNFNSDNFKVLLPERVKDIFEDSKGYFWIATNENGAVLLSSGLEKLDVFNQNNQLLHNDVRVIREDHIGNIWIGTFLGVNIYNHQSKSFQTLTHSNQNLQSISHNSIFSIYKGYQGHMWLGTYFGGVSYCKIAPALFKNYYEIGKEEELLNFPVVSIIKEDQNNNIWIGTEGGGLNILNKKTGVISKIKKGNGKFGLSANNIKDFCFVNDSLVFISIHLGGLNKLNLNTGEVTYYFHDEKDSTSIHTNRTTELHHWNDKILIGGTGGVSVFDLKTEKFSPFTSVYMGTVYCITEDSFNNLWFGTQTRGVYIFNGETREQITLPLLAQDSSLLSSAFICSVYQDNDFNIWIATLGDGLIKLNKETGRLKQYTKAKHNLASDFVLGVQQAKNGDLWISTRKGLSRLEIDSEIFHHTNYLNGFPLKELNNSSLFLADDNELFVGGIDGLVSFQEKDLEKQELLINLHFASLTVNNKIVNPLDETGILEKTIYKTSLIELKPKYKSFAIKFAASNYDNDNQGVFQYKLEGFDSEWITSENYIAGYTNLKPGKYTFKVNVLNSFNRSLVDEKELKIKILPPFYLTWTAYISYVIFVFFIIFWLNRNYRNKILLDHQIKFEQKEKEGIKAVNQAKLSFFTNISHEFRTPLTLILSSLELFLEDSKLNPKQYNRILSISKNANQLRGLIDELLDFRKQEQGYLKLKVQEINIVPFLEEIFQSFIEFANHKQVDYTFNCAKKEIKLWIDPVQLQKVFYNLLSNAFKYVEPNTGKITLEIDDLQDGIDIKIIDNGLGMSAEKIGNIFDRFYQVENNPSKIDGYGSGIGLALSKGIIESHKGKISVESQLYQGSVFHTSLKKGKSHFDPETIYIEQDYTFNKSFVFKTELESNISELPCQEGFANKPTLLIVEDTKEALDLIADVFIDCYHILTAENGEEGLQIAIDKQPDIIISDVMMPVLSGTEMCTKLKRNIITSHIPVILLSARTAIEFKLEGIETGADDYVEKPFNVKLLKARVINLLQNRKLLQERFNTEPRFDIKILAKNKIDKEVLEKATQIVQNNIMDEKFQINAFASEMGLGRTKLFAKIKGLTGQTPNDFIQTIRMNQAAELLLTNPEMNVSDVAYSVGFSTPKYFSHYFHKHFGVSPSKYVQNATKPITNESA